jgi:hypothetical protein
MPVPTPRQAQIVARDLHPPVVLRRSEHALQQLAIVGLELVTLPQGTACVLDPHRQRVANRLQLTEVQHARLARERGHVGQKRQARKRLGRKRR